jgi:cytochrome c oxidase subunit 3
VRARIFFSLYFAITGLHALHTIIGLGVLIVMLVMGARGRFGPGYHNPIECAGLYWHFVDIVWIFRFPLLYLVGIRTPGTSSPSASISPCSRHSWS